jgi:hypothetical protein
MWSSRHSPVTERRPVAMGSAPGGHPRVGGERGLSSFELAEQLRAIPAAAGNILFLLEWSSCFLPHNQPEARIKPGRH